MRGAGSGSPTERELRLATEWIRVARLITASIQSRMDFDAGKIDDPLARYAPLKILLSKDLVRELYASGEYKTARELRRTQRNKFAQLLSSLTAEVRSRHRERLRHMDETHSWTTYTDALRQTWFIRQVLFRLRMALWLDFVSLPGSVWIARAACKDLRRLFPPVQVVPIRS